MADINGSGSWGGQSAASSATVIGRAAGQFYRTVLTEKPVAYWRLGEASGTTGADSSGNGRSGTFGGTYTLGVAASLAGDANTAVSFNGGNLQVPHSAPLSPSGFPYLDIVFRIKTTSVTQGVIFDKRNGTTSGYAVRLETNGKVSVNVGDNTNAWVTAANGVVNDGNWHTVVVVIIASSGFWGGQVFVDGVISTLANQIRSYTLANTSPLFIGSDASGAGPDVTLDEVAIIDQTAAPAAFRFDVPRTNYLHSQSYYVPTNPCPEWASAPTGADAATKRVYLCMDGRPTEQFPVSGASASLPEWPTTGSLNARRKLLFDRVAAAWAPFNVIVTTVDPCKYGNSPATGLVQIAAKTGVSVGGASTTGGYTSTTGEVSHVSYVYPNAVSDVDWNVATATAHEMGHGWGLSHQGQWSGTTKISDYNPGDAARAPLMGNPYSAARAMWWKGQTSASSTTIQDNLTVLTTNVGAAPAALGVIRTASDSAVHPVTGPGAVTIAGDDFMLRPSVTVKNAGGTTVATSNTGSQSQTVSIPSGDHTVTVSSNGLLADGNGWGGYDVGTYTYSFAPTVTPDVSGSGSWPGYAASGTGSVAVRVAGSGSAAGYPGSGPGTASAIVTASGSAIGSAATGSGTSSVAVSAVGVSAGAIAVGLGSGAATVAGSGSTVGQTAVANGLGVAIVSGAGSTPGYAATGLGSSTVRASGSGSFAGSSASGAGAAAVVVSGGGASPGAVAVGAGYAYHPSIVVVGPGLPRGLTSVGVGVGVGF